MGRSLRAGKRGTFFCPERVCVAQASLKLLSSSSSLVQCYRCGPSHLAQLGEPEGRPALVPSFSVPYTPWQSWAG